MLKPTLVSLALPAAMAALPFTSQAQAAPAADTSTNTPPAAATAPSAGLMNDWLRQQSDSFNRWDFGGQFRARLEHKEYMAAPGQAGSVDFRENGREPYNTYLLIRQRLHIGYNADWAGIFLEGRKFLHQRSAQSQPRIRSLR